MLAFTSAKSTAVCLVLLVAGSAAAVAADQADGSFNFLVMGDWGGSPMWPFYTTHQEKATAVGMGAVATKLNASFALGLGDNFYDSGVTSVKSDRFKKTFEDVFTASSLKGHDFFRFIAGNHDHVGNVSAQIAYSQVSSRWSFPAPWYTFTEGDKSAGTEIQFVMIDTVLLSGLSHPVVDGVIDVGIELSGSELPGPADAAAAADQLSWIEQQLAESTANYIIVGGHYPVHSICEHGPTSELVNDLEPLLTKHGVSAYVNGHDHCAEHIDMGEGVQFHTIGSAHVNDPSTAHKSTVSTTQLKFHTGAGDGGFASVAVSKDGLVITHRDGDGTVLYTAPAIPPRKTD